MAAAAPLHADRGNGRTYTAADRCRRGETSTPGGLTDGHLKLHPNLHLLDGRDPNQLFKWRREMLPKEASAAADSGTMLPVEIVAEPERRPRRRRIERAGFIEIEFGCGARLCIRGEVAPKTLRQIIELLR